VAIFAGGIPLALFVAIYQPSLWVLSFSYGALVLLVTASDIWLAFPPRLLDLQITVPDTLYIGERAATMVTIAATRWRRATRFELIAEQRGELEPSEVVDGELPVGGEARIALPIGPRRRGKVTVDQVWLRWRGPLQLVEFTRRKRVDRIV